MFLIIGLSYQVVKVFALDQLPDWSMVSSWAPPLFAAAEEEALMLWAPKVLRSTPAAANIVLIHLLMDWDTTGEWGFW